MLLDAKSLLSKIRTRGRTNAEICKALKITNVTLWRWENDKFTPNLTSIQKLVKLANEKR